MPIPHDRAFHRESAPDRRINLPKILVDKQVGRARDALLQRLAAIIDQRQHQAVGVGMRFDLDDATQKQLLAIPDQMIGARHAHAGHIGLRQSNVLNLRDLKPGHGHAFRQQFDGNINIDIVLDP